VLRYCVASSEQSPIIDPKDHPGIHNLHYYMIKLEMDDGPDDTKDLNIE